MSSSIQRGAAVALTWLLALACASTAPRPATPESASAPPAVRIAGEEADPSSRPMAEALKRALAEGWQTLHIEAECQTDGRLLAVEIFGNGVGLWNEKAQFQLTPFDVRTHLAAFRDSGFAAWPESFGGKRDPSERKNQSPQVICRVGLEIEAAAKHVVQLRYGEQSDRLRRLAGRILDASREPARTGIRADDLQDGLAKIASGVLAPEAFQIIVNRRGGLTKRAVGGESWLLRADGRQVSTRLRTRKGSPGPRRLALDAEHLAKLANLVREVGVAELPLNLYAEQYTDVLVRVLNRRVQIQARRFDGMTATTHGEAQARFDKLFERLHALHLRVLQEGRLAAAPDA